MATPPVSSRPGKFGYRPERYRPSPCGVRIADPRLAFSIRRIVEEHKAEHVPVILAERNGNVFLAVGYSSQEKAGNQRESFHTSHTSGTDVLFVVPGTLAGRDTGSLFFAMGWRPGRLQENAWLRKLWPLFYSYAYAGRKSQKFYAHLLCNPKYFL